MPDGSVDTVQPYAEGGVLCVLTLKSNGDELLVPLEPR
jgi:hypothetical protein